MTDLDLSLFVKPIELTQTRLKLALAPQVRSSVHLSPLTVNLSPFTVLKTEVRSSLMEEAARCRRKDSVPSYAHALQV